MCRHGSHTPELPRPRSSSPVGPPRRRAILECGSLLPLWPRHEQKPAKTGGGGCAACSCGQSGGKPPHSKIAPRRCLCRKVGTLSVARVGFRWCATRPTAPEHGHAPVLPVDRPDVRICVSLEATCLNYPGRGRVRPSARLAEERSWSATACCRFGRATNRSLRKRAAGMCGLFGAAKAVASHRTPRLRKVGGGGPFWPRNWRSQTVTSNSERPRHPPPHGPRPRQTVCSIHLHSAPVRRAQKRGRHSAVSNARCPSRPQSTACPHAARQCPTISGRDRARGDSRTRAISATHPT